MDFAHIDILNYFIYFGASVLMLAIFSPIYLFLTPFDELALIRQGQGAACMSLSGTLLGFSLTLAASAIYNTSIVAFLTWSAVAMIVQLLGYMVIIKIIGNVTEQMERNNVAVGGLIGFTGLVLGVINAGCLS